MKRVLAKILCRLNIHPWWDIYLEDNWYVVRCKYCGKKVRNLASELLPTKEQIDEFLGNLEKRGE